MSRRWPAVVYFEDGSQERVTLVASRLDEQQLRVVTDEAGRDFAIHSGSQRLMPYRGVAPVTGSHPTDAPSHDPRLAVS